MLACEHLIPHALADRILATKRSGDAGLAHPPTSRVPSATSAVERLEAEIDTHVFRLHGLTPEEIALIQGSTP